MSTLPRVMVGGPVRDREWAVPLWLGGLLATSYPKELLELVILVNDSVDDTLAACEWWAARARHEGFARAVVVNCDLGTTVDNNARQKRDYAVYQKLRDLWSEMRGDAEFLYSVDSDVQVPHYLLQGLVGFAQRDGYDLLAAVIANNWAPAPEHATNVMVLDQDGAQHHSKLAHASRELTPRPCVLTGACCVIRASLFDEGFRYTDPAQPQLAEDNVFCQQLLRAQKKMGYVPGLRATHWHRPPVDLEYLGEAGWWERQAAYAEARATAIGAPLAAPELEPWVHRAGAQQATPLREVG